MSGTDGGIQHALEGTGRELKLYRANNISAEMVGKD